MPPKKGKKGKKNDDDWVEPVSKTATAGKLAVGDGDEGEDTVLQAPKKGAFGFQALESEEMPEFNHDENGEDLGGLMSMLGKAKKKGGKKNKKKTDYDDEDDAAAILARLDAEEAAAAAALAGKNADEMDGQGDSIPSAPAPASKKKAKKGKKKGGAADDGDSDQDAAAILAKLDLEEKLAASERGDAAEEVQPAPSTNGKQNKKGGKKAKKNDYDDEEDAAAILAKLDAEEAADKEVSGSAAASPNAKQAKKNAEKEDVEVEKEMPPEPGTIHIKSKKEKERERKERAKLAAKKKQPAKKSGGGLEDSLAAEQSAPFAEEAVPEPVSGKGGKKKTKGPSAAILAIREAMAAQKAAEEQAAREAEEEERRLAEIAAREAEEARLKEEARQKKKEKEKARKEELKKAGLYMTPAQKAAQAQQKAKLEAMLASGVVVPALAKDDGDDQAHKRKRPVYSNRKKKPQQQQQAVVEKKESIAIAAPPKKAPSAVSADDLSSAREDEVKDSWDASSDDERAKPAGDDEVKESWDATSSDEDVKDSWDQESVEDAVEEKAAPAKINGKGDVAAKKPPAFANTKSKLSPKEEEEQDEDEESEGESEDDDDEEEDEDDSDDDDEDDSDDDGLTAAERQELERKEAAAARRQERIAASYAARSKDNLRSPICCILGHVDTGKTKLLDKIRQTNVQEGEAGGITQQIGATYFPLSAIEEKTEMIHKGEPSGYKLPGLLVIDTPGHESFTNLRSRGSSLCNIAVLVVDIVHGLEPQTIESLNLLRSRKTPFIVALNKIDRLFDWKTHANYPTRETLALQKPSVISEFNDRVTKTIVAFAEQGLNACLYWDNKNLGRNVSLVPTSAITGEGVPDLLHLLMDLTQSRMTEKLMYLSELECTVLEVKVIEGLGTTIDVVLSNGVLKEGDKICVCGLNGPIVTTVRALLTPQPMRELRVKSAYQHHKTVKASLGIKIAAPDLEKAIAGSRLLLIGPDDDEEEIMEEVMGDLTNLMTSIDKSGKGVCVQASTLGSLEALLSFLKDSKIPVSGINIGPVHKKDIIRASVMLERAKEYAQLLAFDVPIDKDAEQLAIEMGVKIFSANIIYHLFDKFTAYMKELEEQKRKDAMPTAVFPCVLKMVPDAIFNKRAPIIIGVDVIEGVLKVGTPLCVVNKESGQTIDLGKVVGIELNRKARNEVKKGDPAVAIRVESPNYATTATYGRHFTQDDDIYSKISRESIDVLKTTFRNEVSKEGWALVIKLKKVLSIA